MADFTAVATSLAKVHDATTFHKALSSSVTEITRNPSSSDQLLTKMDEIIFAVANDATLQESLGSEEMIRLILSILASCTSPTAPLAKTTSTDDNSKQEAAADTTKKEEAKAALQAAITTSTIPHVGVLSSTEKSKIVEKSLWLLVRLCRRSMEKTTACVATCDLLEHTPFALGICIQAANEYHAEKGVGEALCWFCMVLASDSEERQFLLTAAGATAVVVQVMRIHFAHPDVAEMACRAARNLAAGDDDIVAQLVDDGVCEMLVKILETYTKDAISNTNTSNNDNKASDVSIAALWAIVNLSCDERVSLILGSVGAVDAVVALAAQWHELGVVAALPLLSAIRNLSAAGTLNYSLLARCEVCKVTCQMLQHYSALSSSPATGSPIDERMCEHDPEIAEAALWAITNMACDLGLAKRLAQECQAATLVVQTYFNLVITPKHPAEGKPAGPISEACLWAITNLAAGSQENEGCLGAAGAVGVVARCLVTYVHREGMVEIATQALIHLTFRDVENKRRLGGWDGQADGSGTNHCNSSSSRNSSSSSSGSVADRIRATKDASGTHTVFPILIQCLRERYKTNEDLCHAGLRLFRGCLEGCLDNREVLRHLHIDEVAVEVMRNHWQCEDIVRTGCDILLHLCYDTSEHRQRLCREKQLTVSEETLTQESSSSSSTSSSSSSSSSSLSSTTAASTATAKPTGTFEQIAHAWKFADILAPSQIPSQMPSQMMPANDEI